MPQNEKRKFSRVPFNSTAIVRNRKIQTEGKIENLSLNGALLNMPEKIETGRDLEIEIFLIEPAADISIKLNGKVLRHTPEGIAIQFTGMYTKFSLWLIVNGKYYLLPGKINRHCCLTFRCQSN